MREQNCQREKKKGLARCFSITFHSQCRYLLKKKINKLTLSFSWLSGWLSFAIAIGILTPEVFLKYLLKSSLVMLGRWLEAPTDFSKFSPHVLVKKSVSLLLNRGSLRTAGRFTVDMKIVHFSWSSTSEGPSAFLCSEMSMSSLWFILIFSWVCPLWPEIIMKMFFKRYKT